MKIWRADRFEFLSTNLRLSGLGHHINAGVTHLRGRLPISPLNCSSSTQNLGIEGKTAVSTLKYWINDFHSWLGRSNEMSVYPQSFSLVFTFRWRNLTLWHRPPSVSTSFRSPIGRMPDHSWSDVHSHQCCPGTIQSRDPQWCPWGSG
jgi:hypothetical protein